VLARITAASGARREAIDLHRRAIELWQVTPDPDPAAIARNRLALARLLCETGGGREGLDVLATAAGAPAELDEELSQARAACAPPGRGLNRPGIGH
jgi:hypothetical protein